MVVVILAAGAARRMQQQKLLLPVDGRPMIDHVIAAVGARPVVLVAGDDVAAAFAATSLCIVRNASPERGMSHSLALADAAIPEHEPIAVVVADMPDLSATAIDRVLAAYDDSVDVVVARRGEHDGHPVVFGPAARRKIGMLPDGDTIKRLRDDPALRRRFVDLHEAPPMDIDTPADYRRRTSQTEKQVESSR